MQAICGTSSKKRGFGKIFLTIVILVSIACLSFLRIYFFYYAIHPFLTMLYIPVYDKEGVDLYTQEEYLNYEYGKEFKNYVSSYDFTQNGEVTYFYYRDNYTHDNPIYGKVCDIFAVDIKLSSDDYAVAKETIITDEYRLDTFPSGYVLYLPKVMSGENYTPFFALKDTECTVRFILITETEDTDAYSISGLLYRRSSLSFD